MAKYPHIHSKVAGVTFKDKKGQSRQYIIEKFCKPGMPLILKRERHNPHGKNAIAIWIKVKSCLFSKDYQIGYINSKLSDEIAPLMDKRKKFSGYIDEITGGDKDKESFGVNIVIYQIS